jgi:hypothetical protein
MIWKAFGRQVDLGFLPSLISEDDPRPVAQQLDDKYRHGGGWQPMPGWKLSEDRSLKFPEDPPMKPLAMSTLRHETLLFYEYSFLAIVQLNGSFEVSRID